MPFEIRLLIAVVLSILVVYSIVHEQALIRFEHKIWKYIKAFFKALYYTINDIGGKTK